MSRQRMAAADTPGGGGIRAATPPPRALPWALRAPGHRRVEL